MMGMNDCTAGPDGRSGFRRDLDSFAAAVAKRQSLLLLHTPNLIYFPQAPERKDLPAYADIVRDYAHRNDLPLVDHYREWSETRRSADEQLALLTGGGIHPNQYGHIYLAHLTFRRIGIFDPASPTCRLFVP
jgi:hypothetical protein